MHTSWNTLATSDHTGVQDLDAASDLESERIVVTLKV